MDLTINASQLRKYKKGMPFQMTHSQLMGNHTKGGKLYSINVPPSKAISNAIRTSKGIRLNAQTHGGSIISTFKSIGNNIEKGAKQAGKEIVKTANDVDKWAKKNDIGGLVEQVKKQVPQGTMTIILTSAISAAAVASGNPVLIAAAPVLAASASTAFYKADFSKSLDGQGEKVGMAALTTAAKESGKAKASYDKAQSKGEMVGEGFSNIVVSRAKKLPRSTASVVRNSILMDANQSTNGGSFMTTGGSFKPTGGSFKPTGSGLMPTSRPTKGSAEARAWGQKMMAARNAKKM
jgi:hypothetical protein